MAMMGAAVRGRVRAGARTRVRGRGRDLGDDGGGGDAVDGRIALGHRYHLFDD